jgi:hypothetical protein
MTAPRENLFRGHYGYVLGSLLTILALYPFVDETGWLNVVLELAFLAVILSCLLVSLGRRTQRILLIVAVAAELLALGARLAGTQLLEGPGHVLRVAVLLGATVAVLHDVVRSKRVTMDTIFAAASAYLLMALAWASVYITLEAARPGSFSLGPIDGPQAMGMEAQLTYFSLITITTVGFGDITPVCPQASMLAALQGLIGQLYIAILLARLVALELSGRQDRKRNDDGEP